MRILDLTAGRRAVWFDKSYRDTTFIDIRPEVKPDYVADSGCLPDEIGTGFDLVVFDPPHANYGANGHMSKRYGHFTLSEIRRTITASAKEAHRVSRGDALMALKWNDHDIKLSAVIGLLSDYWEPLFGHGVNESHRRHHMTSWVMLRRRRATMTGD